MVVIMAKFAAPKWAIVKYIKGNPTAPKREVMNKSSTASGLADKN